MQHGIPVTHNPPDFVMDLLVLDKLTGVASQVEPAAAGASLGAVHERVRAIVA